MQLRLKMRVGVAYQRSEVAFGRRVQKNDDDFEVSPNKIRAAQTYYRHDFREKIRMNFLSHQFNVLEYGAKKAKMR